MSSRLVQSAIQRKAKAPESIAVVGGGISGLASAFYAARQFPEAKRIRLYEAGNRVGGWIRSARQENVLFEQASRTLRPSGLPARCTLSLVSEVGLEDSVVAVSRKSAAARNRFVYVDGQVVKMPVSTREWLFPPAKVFRSIMWAGMREMSRSSRVIGCEDESISSFFSRRFSPVVATALVSALTHGIYAGNADRLSMRSCFRSLWDMETKFGTVVLGQLVGSPLLTRDEKHLEKLLKQEVPQSLAAKVKDMSVYTFRDGLQALPDAVAQRLDALPQVEMTTTSPVAQIARDQNKVVVTSVDGASEAFDHVVSTVPAPVLASVLPQSPDYSALLTGIDAVTVMVVSLFYRAPHAHAPFSGFGALFPKMSRHDNPEAVLGVVFDSDVVTYPDEPEGTKLTVMLGGEYWTRPQDIPDKAAGIAAAKAAVKRHLNLHAEPDIVHATLQRDCIPQYEVGHADNMDQLHWGLLHSFDGRLSVTGAWYNGVSVNDCVMNARLNMQRLGLYGGVSGLEFYSKGGALEINEIFPDDASVPS